MKNFLKAILLCLSLYSSELIFAQGPQTEDYAILTTYQRGKKNYVNVAIGNNNNKDVEIPAGEYNLTHLVGEMEKLNKMGYKLLNGSNAVIPFGVNLAGGFPVFMLVFVKQAGN